MSDSTAAHAFLPWLRRGLAGSIARVDGSGSPAPRALAQLAIDLNNHSLSAAVPLTLAGPGDVAGLDPRAIIRVWPRPAVQDAEPNFFPLIEFDQADLPWRYTPARATTQDRLRPWICLVALRDDEIESYTAATVRGTLPIVTVKSAASLPKLDQSWAWAHAQVSGGRTISTAELAELFHTAPERVTSRLLCPRRLDPRIGYRAFLVPTYERGRLAGIGEKVTDGVDSLTLAWADGAARVALPVYYEWRFQTGVVGDFEFLVRQLQARVLPASVGFRDMDVTSPGGGLPGAAASALALQGALKATNTVPGTWPEPQRSNFIAPLQTLLNAPAEMLSQPGANQVVAPPLYGRWHAARTTLDPVQPPPWFQELNSDPRNRVAAGLGTQVVQAQQQQLMASAWQQLDQIRAINERLRFAQFARETALRIHARHVATADAESVLQLTAPVHARVRSGTATVYKQISASPVGVGVLQGQFRRVTRPMGPIVRRQGRVAQPSASTVLTRMNAGRISAAPPPPKPAAMATPGTIGNNVPDWGSAVWTQELNLHGGPALPAQGFRALALNLFQTLSAPVADAPAVVAVNLPQVSSELVAALDPKVTMVESIRKRLRLAPGLEWQPKDPLEPVMAAPEFAQPMSQPLAELSQDWLLPGLQSVPPNTVSLLKTNQPFIEAFMVGLNHEFSRELLWNEYPTDQRGSYFRQFWNVAGRVPNAGETVDAEALKDVKPIHAWPKTSALGGNSPRPTGAVEPLVLLVRGDLLRRYPNALVYAVKAKLAASGKRDLSDEERHPLFMGRLDPDVAFYGFDLDVTEVRGGNGQQGWFFVLQEQPSEPRFGLDVAGAPGGSLSAWGDLSWGHLAADAAGLNAITYIDLNASLPDTHAVTVPAGEPVVAWHDNSGLGATGSKASDLAYITLQRPVRVAVHASQMLP
jgi:hypothetical protein